MKVCLKLALGYIRQTSNGVKQIIIIIIGILAIIAAIFRQGPVQRGIRRDVKKEKEVK